jgi:hypothetical protein
MHESNSIEVDCDPMTDARSVGRAREMAGLEKRWHVAKKAALDLLYRANIHRCCSSNLAQCICIQQQLAVVVTA